MDALFTQIVNWNNNRKWGNVLDAGSGAHSLSWLLGLETESVTALTGDPQTKSQLMKQFNTSLRDSDQIICGNWLNQSLFEGQLFDTVLVDYLIGSLNRFSPYLHNQIFQQIRNRSKTKLYLIGQEPIIEAETPDQLLIKGLFELRDACILLSGHAHYREYPQIWCQQELTKAGFRVCRHKTFQIKVDRDYLNRQFDVCRSKLPYMATKQLQSAMSDEMDRMSEQLFNALKTKPFLSGLRDYVIEAEL